MFDADKAAKRRVCVRTTLKSAPPCMGEISRPNSQYNLVVDSSIY